MTSPSVRLAGAAAALSVVLLSGCSGTSGDGPSPTGSPATSAAEPTSTSEPASEPGLSEPSEDGTGATITCAEVEPLASPITGAFTLSPDDSSEAPSGTTCVWTNAAVDAASTDLADYAALGITVDGTTWSADELETLPGASDDPRAAALGGRLLIGDGATLGEAGSVQVLFPRGTVTVVATGALLSAAPDTQIPVDAVVDVAVEVAGLR